MADRFPSEKAEKIVVRLPDGMRDLLAEVAKTNGRSVNSEVVARLHASLLGTPLAPLISKEGVTLGDASKMVEHEFAVMLRKVMADIAPEVAAAVRRASVAEDEVAQEPGAKRARSARRN